MTLRFTEGGEARLFRNGSLVKTVGFETSPGPDKGSLEVRYAEPLMGFDVQTATFPSTFALVLTDPCCDGFTSRYFRIP
jgi:hypothetical protein